MVGENLSTALIERHGGHIYDTWMAIQKIQSMSMSRGVEPCNRIQESLNSCKTNVDKTRMVKMLRDIAEKGFAPLDRENDPVAEILSKHDICGVVSDLSSNSGLRTDVFLREKCFFGVVPSKQSTRLSIALQLQKNSKDETWERKCAAYLRRIVG